MKLPEGPTTNPLLQSLQWLGKPVDYMETNAAKYGGMFTARWGKQTVVMVSHPEAMQTMLTSKCLAAPGEANEIARPLQGDNSLILQSGSRHQRSRQLLMPSFHGERMRNYGDLIGVLTEKAMSKWPSDRPFTAHAAMQDITMSVILQAVFGLYEGKRYQKLKELFFERLEMTGSLVGALLLYFPAFQKDWGSWSPWGRIMQKVRQIDEILYAEISDRRAKPDPERTDILTLLMSARDESGEGMADAELRDQMMTLLFAGHETTATALACALYWVHKHPEIKEKLLQELDSLGDNPESMAIYRLPYLSAVCNETMRISPGPMLTFPRVVRSTVEIMGHKLEPGVETIGSIYLTHQREDLYPEPKRFKPERFLEKQFSPYEFIPFGAGDRRCIGMALAQFEMKLVLARVLSEAELALVDDKPLEMKRRGILLAPSGGIPMVMKSINN
ncbi:MAG: cytochrome P450 [Cyanobacteriota bacterium]|nr:cytochrome P450 [Cyanobacteriota bacterium]